MLERLGNLLLESKSDYLGKWQKSFLQKEYIDSKKAETDSPKINRATSLIEVLVQSLLHNSGLDHRGFSLIRQMVQAGDSLREIIKIVLELKKFLQYLLLEETWLAKENEQGIYILDTWVNNILLDVAQAGDDSYLEFQQAKVKELSAISEINRIIGDSLNLNDVLQMICQTLGEIIQEKLTIMLVDSKFSELSVRASYNWKNSAKINSIRIKLGEGIEGYAALNKQTMICKHIVAEPRVQNFGFLLSEGVVSIISFPLIANGKVLGTFNVYLTSSKDELKAWADSLQNLINHATVAIENAILYKHNFESYLITIKALVAAVDAKDMYTRGHSERVMEYAMLIAYEMGLTPKEIEEIKIAGLLHDVGKIGIDTNILNKPGRLNEEEFNTIKAHPTKGAKILQQVEFLSSIIPAILHHHERFDGKGYPSGLKQDEIPLAARILSVADALDAMISDRAYRAGLPIEHAIAELEKNSGTQFDPEVVEAFLRVMGRTS